MTWSKAITDWRQDTFGPVTPERALHRVREEWDELWPRSSTAQKVCSCDQGDNAEEAADVVITLAAFVATLGYDLAEVVEAKMAKNRARKWRVDGTGCGYHVKDGDD